jgi:hypothetical protein
MGFTILKTDDTGGKSTLPADGVPLAPCTRQLRDSGVRPGRTYHYALTAWLADGNLARSATVRTSIPAVAFTVGQNHPNPFNPSTRIAFSLQHTTPLEIVVHDAGGRHIVTLADKTFPAGPHTVEWDGNNTTGQPAASGVYFCRFVSRKQRATVKMTLVR